MSNQMKQYILGSKDKWAVTSQGKIWHETTYQHAMALALNLPDSAQVWKIGEDECTLVDGWIK